MATQSHPGAYSANVRIWLDCDGRIIQLAQLSTNWVIPQQPTELPPCEATVFLEIDGRASGRRVRLPDGMALDSDLVTITSIESRDPVRNVAAE